MLLSSNMEMGHNHHGTTPPLQYHKMVTVSATSSTPTVVMMSANSPFFQMSRSRPGSVVKDGSASGTASKRGSLTGGGLPTPISPLPSLGGKITEIIVSTPSTPPRRPLALTLAPVPPPLASSLSPQPPRPPPTLNIGTVWIVTGKQ